MRSRIYTGHVMHARLKPVRHQFKYPIYFYALDLDELPEMARIIPLFGYNRFRPIAIHDKDFLFQGSATIKEKILKLLNENGISKTARITLITQARFLGYVFNPVSFYYCFDSADQLVCVVAEVTNTFHETHLYVLREGGPKLNGYIGRFSATKEFFVSPFLDISGEYDFRCSEIGESLDVWVDLKRNGETIITTQLFGNARELTFGNVLQTLVRYPLVATLNLPRILWEAAKLHYGKRQPIVAKPIPNHPHTIRKSRPYLYQKIAMALILRYFKNWTVGELEIQLPDGVSHTFGSSTASHSKSTIRVKDYRFFWRLLRDGDVGMGDSFMWGEWDTENLPKLLGHFVENESALNGHNVALNILGRISHKIMHLRNPNTIRGSRKNIQRHYDLSNDMYKLFLDPTMMYSCAIFSHHEESLERAQQNKVNAIIQKADIQPEHHVLEIGSGWGHFAIEAVRQTGCRVTSITISEEQLKLARERVKAAGFEDRIRIELCDYRKLEGSFDRIVSIEMLEAIGAKQYDTFFSVCDKSLKPGGRAVVQVITIPDERFEGHRRRVDWLQKHIFPGGLLPSLQALKDAMQRSSNLSVVDVENIGPHYTLTLAHWRKQFLEARERILELGFDETFIRMWLYYLGYCEAAFATRYVNDLQIILTRGT